MWRGKTCWRTGPVIKPDVQPLTTKLQRSNDILKCDWEGCSIPYDWVEQERFDEEIKRISRLSCDEILDELINISRVVNYDNSQTVSINNYMISLIFQPFNF